MQDPVAPWIHVFLQLGAVGVLGLLAWQVPRLVKLVREWRQETETAHRTEREQMREEHKQTLAQQRVDNKDALAAVLKHCEEGNKIRDAQLTNVQGELENLQEQIEEWVRSGTPPRRRKGGGT